MTNYPTALDNFTNPTGSDSLSTPAVLHSTQHANANDAIEAIEAKLGDDSTPADLPAGVSLGAASGVGILVDGAYGWRDLEGAISYRDVGLGAPTLSTFRGNIRGLSFAAGDDYDLIYHMPHDHAPGSDLHIHLHWCHNGTGITGNFVITYYITYAKGHRQAEYHAEKTLVQTISTSILTDPQYEHLLDEVQMSTPGGSASMIDTDALELDGMIKIHFDVTTIPTISGGGVARPFIDYVDIHMQSTNATTKNKAPNFYG
jgi:hypothetical protein